MLRYAPRFHRKKLEKNRQKKIKQKKIYKKFFYKIFREFFFQIFFGYHGSTSNLEHACENLGGLGPLVWEEIENEQTVHKGLTKLLYRLADSSATLRVFTEKNPQIFPKFFILIF
jgi:hypothetical protein